MLDFMRVTSVHTRNGIEIVPKFLVKKTKDLMVRGGRFYAIWDDKSNLWRTNEYDAVEIIDLQIDEWVESNRDKLPERFYVRHLFDADSGMIDKWNKFCQSQMSDIFVQLDPVVTFENTPTVREDYRSRRLSYPLTKADTPAWNKIVGTLYDEEERHKIEWSIGCVLSGESINVQKFLVFYGKPGSGKSTILDIVYALFEDYATTFDSEALTSSSNAFAFEAFRNDPLVALHHDAKLNHIENNTRLNSLVSHEYITVNEKYKSSYTSRFRAFLFIGTNTPVKITDSKSGLIRRLIDVQPTGNLIPHREYNSLMRQVRYELGGIASHCIDVFKSDPNYYDEYVPTRMIDATNDLYNFLVENAYGYSKLEGISLKDAWEMYKGYCQESNVPYPLQKRIFKEELKEYFVTYYDKNPNGYHQRDWYVGLKLDKFPTVFGVTNEKNDILQDGDKPWITLDDLIEQDSVLDKDCANYRAQYATTDGVPKKAWANVRTNLGSINTSKLHYVKLPETYIVIDCDLKKDGIKDPERNVLYAQSLPPTYAELSKSGGLHLHYIYTGDPYLLANVIEEGIEIKTCTGGQAIRRKLTKCNGLPISTLSSGLPIKEEGKPKMINVDTVMNENRLRATILKIMRKEVHADTKSSVDFIVKVLNDAYESGMSYDLRDLTTTIQNFAANSTNNSSYCLKLCVDMHLCSEDVENGETGYSNHSIKEEENWPILFFDVEVFQNFFGMCYRIDGEDQTVIKMAMPTREAVRQFIESKARRIGFNNKRYDNHILYAYAYRNYDTADLYKLSEKIISNTGNNCMFGEAYNISYTDIYDFSSKKQSLKKWQNEMGITHREFPYPWNEPLGEEHWEECMEYCSNDVESTYKLFHHLSSDYTARLALAELTGMSPNASTNALSARLIFGTVKKPQNRFNYFDLSKPVRPDDPVIENMGEDYVFHIFDQNGDPTYEIWDKKSDIPKGYSVMPFFPGYEFKFGVSTYMGIEVGEGGYVYSEPGAYRHVSLLDVESMHPSSIRAMMAFGPIYTKRFGDLVDTRLCIKHGNLDKAENLFDGAFVKYLKDPSMAEALSYALKIVINSVYGVTKAHFDNPFRDPRNADNIVAKRGALFMIKLYNWIKAKGFKPVHIKTDSIKIPGATDDLIRDILDFAYEYGYTFEYEACYDVMCLINDADYIARYDECGYRNKGGKSAGKWTATGKRFSQPWILKGIFTGEEIDPKEYAQMFSVKTAIYNDFDENLPDDTQAVKDYAKLEKQGLANSDVGKELEDYINSCHNYVFVGKTGLFVPVVDGCNGGRLYREMEKGDKKGYAAVAGTTGFRWIEYEVAKSNGMLDKIDMSYYQNQTEEAIDIISQYVDFGWFVHHDLSDPVDKIYPF